MINNIDLIKANERREYFSCSIIIISYTACFKKYIIV